MMSRVGDVLMINLICFAIKITSLLMQGKVQNQLRCLISTYQLPLVGATLASEKCIRNDAVNSNLHQSLLYMHLCVCMPVLLCLSMLLCACMCICACVYMHVCVCAHACVCAHVCVHKVDSLFQSPLSPRFWDYRWPLHLPNFCFYVSSGDLN